MRIRFSHARAGAGGPKPDTRILVRGARQLLTLHGESGGRRGEALADLGVIVDGSLLIRNGIIENAGPTRSIENLAGARDAEEINAAGRVVMPAFIDPHACLVPVPACRHQTTRSVGALPATRLEAQADALAKIMARHGTATIGALSGHGDDAGGELKILRTLQARHLRPLDIVPILVATGRTRGGAESGVVESREESADRDLELLMCAARRKLVRVAAVRSGTGDGVPRESAERLMSSAHELGLGIRLELLGERETELVDAAVNRHALSISAPGPYCGPEIELIAGSSTVAILLPELLARTGQSGTARELIDRGAMIALGSGLSPDQQSTASMQTAVQMACGLGLSLAEAISAATVNAAWALGVGPQMGTLEHGKQADLILLNASDYREIPLLAGTNLTYSMIKRGVLLFREDFAGW